MFTYFAAVDVDPDGLSTSLYRVRTDRRVTSDTCPDDVYPLLRQTYFGASDLFTVSADQAEAMLRSAGASWYVHEGIGFGTVPGNGFRRIGLG